MKKIILAAIILVSVAASAMANDNINNAASNLVKKDFPSATNISYKEAKDYTVVSFDVNNQRMQAFYDNSGNKISTSRNIKTETLPGEANATIAKNYAGFTATEAIEMNNEQDGITYYVYLQNAQQKVILQIDTDGDVTVFKKTNL